MEISIFRLFLLFLVSFISSIDSVLDEFQFHRPIIICPLVGLILGDLNKGLIIGGTLEMIMLGWMNIGAVVCPDSSFASLISTILVILGKQSISTGIALSIPLSALGQISIILVRTFTVLIQHACDKFSNSSNIKMIQNLHLFCIFIQGLRVSIPIMILTLSLNTNIINSIFKSIPVFVNNSFNIFGGIVVVVGYAMVLNMIIKNYLIPFFCLGYIISLYTNLNLIAIGIIALSISFIYLNIMDKIELLLEKKNIDNNDDLGGNEL